jgi:hypothetical protein
MPRSEMISYHAAEFVKGEIPGSDDVLAPKMRTSLPLGDLWGEPASEVGAGALSLKVILLQVDQIVPSAVHGVDVVAEDLTLDLDHPWRFVAHLADADSSFVTSSRSPSQSNTDGATRHSDGQEYGGRVRQGPKDVAGMQVAVQLTHGCLAVH